MREKIKFDWNEDVFDLWKKIGEANPNACIYVRCLEADPIDCKRYPDHRGNYNVVYEWTMVEDDAYCADGTADELLYDKFFEDPFREHYRYMRCTEFEDIDIKYDENNIPQSAVFIYEWYDPYINWHDKDHYEYDYKITPWEYW